MSSKKIITVFGATGKQGGSVVQAFLKDAKLKDEWAVRGVSRKVDGDAAKQLTSQGVEMVAANLNDKASLVKAMTGAYAVFSMTNYWETMDMQVEIDQGKRLANAAKEKGVKVYIWSSLINVKKLTNGKLPHVYHFDSKALVEDYARSINLPATFFMPGFFMSNLPGGMFRQLAHLDNNWTLALPLPETAPIPLFDPEDTGKWIKAIVSQKPEDVVNKQVYAASSYVTPKEIVTAFQKQYREAGNKASFVSVPHAQFQETLQRTGMPAFAAEELLENLRLMDEGGYYGGAGLEDSHKLLVEGDVLTTWEEFMKKAPAFESLG